MQNECSLLPHDESPTPCATSVGDAEDFSRSSRVAIDATSELSSPPESRTPHGTSLIMRRRTESVSAWRSAGSDKSRVGTLPAPSRCQAGSYHRTNPRVLEL